MLDPLRCKCEILQPAVDVNRFCGDHLPDVNTCISADVIRRNKVTDNFNRDTAKIIELRLQTGTTLPYLRNTSSRYKQNISSTNKSYWCDFKEKVYTCSTMHFAFCQLSLEPPAWLNHTYFAMAASKAPIACAVVGARTVVTDSLWTAQRTVFRTFVNVCMITFARVKLIEWLVRDNKVNWDIQIVSDFQYKSLKLRTWQASLSVVSIANLKRHECKA